MRHLGSFLLSLVFAPLIWVGTGIGLSKFAEGLTDDPDYLAAIVGLLGLGLAGLLLAVLMLMRLSPVGPVLVGLAYFGATAWALASPTTIDDVFPRNVVGVENAGLLPLGGTAALLAVPLIATVVSPRRWRRFDRLPDAGTHPTMYGTPQATSPSSPYSGSSYSSPLPPPTYAPPGYGAQTYDAAPKYDSPQTYSPSGGYGASSPGTGEDTRPLPPGS